MPSHLRISRRVAAQLLNFCLAISTCFMIWKGLSVASASPTPVVVVLSGSMEPAFQRGDLILLWNNPAPTHVGAVVVYEVKDRDIPIVHRVVRSFNDGHTTKLLTKGDNNAVDDTELYAKGQEYLTPDDLVGGVVGYVPYVGYVTILLSEYPWLKTALFGLMGFAALLQRS